ncbi:hypothetical protein [Streptomyces koelreuteriae]|uniref:hypothetical protein n=1 Tax=Streptomyces koelreuteriae TaxID=2838015 RepID=UPI003EB91520
MIYDLLLTGAPVSPESLSEALAEAVRTEGAAVDVADRDGDQSQRGWTAPVLCGYVRLRRTPWSTRHRPSSNSHDAWQRH